MEGVETLQGIKNMGFVRLRSLLWPEERLTLLFFLFSVFFVPAYGVSILSGWDNYLYFFFAMLVPVFGGIALVGALVLKYLGRLESRDANPFTKEYLKSFLRIFITLFVGFYAYSHLKVLIPLVNGENYDGLFANLDTLLFFGVSPTLLMLKIKDPYFIKLMYLSYASFYPAFCLSIGVSFLQKNLTALRKLVMGILVIYIMGIFLYYLFPSWGPLFFTPELFSDIPNIWQNILWKGHLAVQISPQNFETTQFLGVAAFPSLHGAHFLFLMLVAWRYHRPLFYIYIPWGILLYISTIYMGWHYVVDLIAGVFMAFLAIYVCNKTVNNVRR